MTGQNIGYIRVSSFEQNEARQLSDVQLDKKFIDKISGSKKDRPQLNAMLKHIRDGDTVHIHSMDRLARNLVDLKNIVTKITDLKVNVIFYKEKLTFSKDENNMMANLMLNMIGSFAEFERELILERQREGIEQAKKKGVYKGRKPTLSDNQVQELQDIIQNNPKINKAELARKYQISRETLYRYIRDEN